MSLMKLSSLLFTFVLSNPVQVQNGLVKRISIDDILNIFKGKSNSGEPLSTGVQVSGVPGNPGATTPDSSTTTAPVSTVQSTPAKVKGRNKLNPKENGPTAANELPNQILKGKKAPSAAPTNASTPPINNTPKPVTSTSSSNNVQLAKSRKGKKPKSDLTTPTTKPNVNTSKQATPAAAPSTGGGIFQTIGNAIAGIFGRKKQEDPTLTKRRAEVGGTGTASAAGKSNTNQGADGTGIIETLFGTVTSAQGNDKNVSGSNGKGPGDKGKAKKGGAKLTKDGKDGASTTGGGFFASIGSLFSGIFG